MKLLVEVNLKTKRIRKNRIRNRESQHKQNLIDGHYAPS